MESRRVVPIVVAVLIALAVIIQPVLGVQGEATAGTCPMIARLRAGVLQQLNLTEAQKAQIKEIIQAQREKLLALRQDKSLTPEQRRAELREIRKAGFEQIRQVLTPEQQEKLAEMRARAGQMLCRGGQMLRRAIASLGLTEVQKAQIKQILQVQKEKLRALHGDSDLTRDQKIAKVREIRQDTIAQIRGVLTPEQQQKLDEMLAKPKARFGRQ